MSYSDKVIAEIEQLAKLKACKKSLATLVRNGNYDEEIQEGIDYNYSISDVADTIIELNNAGM